MSYDNMLQKALKFHQQGNFDEAEKLYRQILQTAPDQPQVLNLLGLIAQSKGLHQEAVSYFEKSILKDFNNFETYFNLGWSLFALGKYNEAANAYHKVIKLKPDTKEAYNSLGEIYALTGNHRKAEEMFHHSLNIDPSYLEAQSNLAYLSNDINKLEQLCQQHPEYTASAYHLALLFQEKGNLSKALDYAVKAAQSTPIEDYQLLAGELHLKNQHPESAKVYFCEALQLNPKSVSALINLANSEPDAKAAEEMYKKALDISPQNFDAHLNYAVLLHNQNRLSEALEEYRQAVILDSNSPEVSHNLGALQRQMGEFTQALGLFFNSFSLSPDNPRYAIDIAETLTIMHQTQPEQAEKTAQRWLEQYPDNIFAQRINAAFKNKITDTDSKYSQQLFDVFASTYEQTMNDINYNLPFKMSEFIGNISGTIIDLGCGTGLLGEQIKRPYNNLIGIDISEQMLQKAKNKNVYDHLEQADIIEYCNHLPPQAFITAADVMGYIGNIEPLLQKVYPHSFAFSVATDNKCPNYSLLPNGRYVYNKQYIQDTLSSCGYQNISSKDCVLRTENGQDVLGTIFLAKEKNDES